MDVAREEILEESKIMEIYTIYDSKLSKVMINQM